MFEWVDIERAFGQDEEMARTGVRSGQARLRLCCLVAGLALAGALTGQVARAAAQRGGAPLAGRPPGHGYVIAYGDTLWSIAARQAPGRDPRPLVSAIQLANNLRAADLVPGRTLFIPGQP